MVLTLVTLKEKMIEMYPDQGNNYDTQGEERLEYFKTRAGASAADFVGAF